MSTDPNRLERRGAQREIDQREFRDERMGRQDPVEADRREI